MSRTRILALLFLLVALVQLALPAARIRQYEQTLREGKAFKFRTAPVDPYDAFRGRYVALRFEAGDAAWGEKEVAGHGQKIFALVETGPDGFARFTSASSHRPASGDFLEAKSSYSAGDNRVRVDVPFDRFYMAEKIAPDAERAYREHSANGRERDAYAIVRIRDGVGVIEQVFVGDKPLAAAAREAAQQPAH